ncbi:caspase family protein [Kribbella sp. NPDC026596]|uniref:caspase, EACC1-associated type n=1 Tax=Kribbella sp. NPDC026596 TaxID=3155122 RepID=UPI0033FE9666
MGRRRALLVATYEYNDTGLRRLTAPAQDAEALAAVLADPAVAGFDVQMLINEPTHRVGEAIADFYAASERDDLTLLYFSGHGLKDDNGRLYLAMKNTKRDSLRFSALPAHLVDEAVSESSSRQKILILDCCYSGAYAVQQFAKADSAVHTGAELGGRGRTVLTATDSTQYAFEGSTIHGDAAQSVFTRHVVEGLRSGAADLDADGDITVDELYSYVYDAVVAEQPGQRPKQFADVEGRTIIASNVRWTLPEQITTALDSPLPAIRETALQPLGQLLRANNELVRRTARARLERLLDDDSRALSAAAQALLDAPPAPAQQLPVAADRAQPARRPSGPTFGAAAKATASRWRATARRWRARLDPPQIVWQVVTPTLVAAGAAIAAALVGFQQQPWYLIAVATVLSCAVAAQIRFRSSAVAFTAGLAAPALAGAALVIGWLTHQVPGLGGLGALSTGFTVGAHAAWLTAGAIGWLMLLRTGELRRPPQMLLIALGAAAALLILVILTYDYHHNAGVARHLSIAPRSVYPAALGILAAELAIAGPLFGLRRPVLAGWILGGFAVWIGLLHSPSGFVSAQLALIALFVVWLVLGLVVMRTGRVQQETVTRSTRRWVIAAALLAPAVLGAAAVAAIPPALQSPLVLGLAISPNSEFLYAADYSNDRVVKISTTTRTEVGESLRVGDQPTRLLLSPDGARLYVANGGANSVSVIDTSAWQVVGGPIAVAPKPTNLALNTATQRLYVLSQQAETITEVDTATMKTVGGPLASGPTPSDLAISEKGDRLFVAGRDSATVAVIDVKTRQPARSPITVGAEPSDLAPGPDGSLYVIGSTTYAVINTNVEQSRPTPVTLPGRSQAAGLSSDGKRLFVLGTADDGDAIRVVNLGSREVVATLTDDMSLPTSLAVSADGQRIYVNRIYQSSILVLDTAGPKIIGTISLTT